LTRTLKRLRSLADAKHIGKQHGFDGILWHTTYESNTTSPIRTQREYGPVAGSLMSSSS
jgi:hypothetical protein